MSVLPSSARVVLPLCLALPQYTWETHLAWGSQRGVQYHFCFLHFHVKVSWQDTCSSLPLLFVRAVHILGDCPNHCAYLGIICLAQWRGRPVLMILQMSSLLIHHLLTASSLWPRLGGQVGTSPLPKGDRKASEGKESTLLSLSTEVFLPTTPNVIAKKVLLRKYTW